MAIDKIKRKMQSATNKYRFFPVEFFVFARGAVLSIFFARYVGPEEEKIYTTKVYGTVRIFRVANIAFAIAIADCALRIPDR